MASPKRIRACSLLLAYFLLPVTLAEPSTQTDDDVTTPGGIEGRTGQPSLLQSPLIVKTDEVNTKERFLLANISATVLRTIDVTLEGSGDWSSQDVTHPSNQEPVMAIAPTTTSAWTKKNVAPASTPTAFSAVTASPKKKKHSNRQKGIKKPPFLEISITTGFPMLTTIHKSVSSTENLTKSASNNKNAGVSSKLEPTTALPTPGVKAVATAAVPSTVPLNDPPWFHESPFYTRGSGSGSGGSNRKPEPPVISEQEDPFAEPSPDWVQAKAQWGIAWEIHLFTAGPLFAVLAAYSLISLFRVRSFIRLLGRGYFISLNTLLVVMGVARSVYLLLDGYNSSGRFPAPLAYFFLNIGYPCLSSAFAILFLALLRATRVQLLSPKVQRPGVLSAAVVFHFSFSISADVIVGSMEGTEVLLFACQLLFALWCLTLASAYFYVFRRLHKAALRKQGEMIRVTFTKLHIDGARLPRKLPRPTLALAVRVTLVTSVLSVAAALLQIYGMVFVYGVFQSRRPEPWPWWGYQFCSRLVEMGMCAALSFVATQPLRDYEEKPRAICTKLFSCQSLTLSCCRCKETVGDTYDAYIESHSNGFRNSGFSHSLDGHTARRGNSLPSFRPVPLSDPDIGCDGLPMQHGGARGGLLRHEMTGGGSLQNARNQRCGNKAVTDGLSVPTALNLTTSSSDGRPTSMLFKDKGFIRFRSDSDPEQPMELSDTATEDDPQSSPSVWGSVKAEAGSSGRQSLCEDDFVQSSLSPFFQHAYRQQQLLQPRFKRFSRCSLETLDNNSGGDLSSEQLSNVVPFGHQRVQHGLSNSALDFQLMHRKYGSTCSSESAANSFDITFFLQQGILPSPFPNVVPGRIDAPSFNNPAVPPQPPPPAALRSISPLATRAAASARRFQGIPLNLDLSRDGILSCGLVNVACGTEDVTPDSAVYLDLHLSRDCDSENPLEPTEPSPSDEVTSPPAPALSHSLSDLSGWRLNTSKCKRSLSFLNRLKGSSFSLNASLHGYEPLGKNDDDKQTERTCKEYIKNNQGSPKNFTSLSDVRPGIGLDILPQVDSGLLGDCRELVVQVDRASQTEVTTPEVKNKVLDFKGEYINGLVISHMAPVLQS